MLPKLGHAVRWMGTGTLELRDGTVHTPGAHTRQSSPKVTAGSPLLGPVVASVVASLLPGHAGLIFSPGRGRLSFFLKRLNSRPMAGTGERELWAIVEISRHNNRVLWFRGGVGFRLLGIHSALAVSAWTSAVLARPHQRQRIHRVGFLIPPWRSGNALATACTRGRLPSDMPQAAGSQSRSAGSNEQWGPEVIPGSHPWQLVQMGSRNRKSHEKKQSMSKLSRRYSVGTRAGAESMGVVPWKTRGLAIWPGDMRGPSGCLSRRP